MSNDLLNRYKHQDITLVLRQRIVEGELRTGSRLPIRIELQQMFDASPTTVQRAMDTLRLEGFVETRGKQGTFVVDQPPHLARYGLVFPHRPTPSQPWPRAFLALAHQATAVSRSGHRRIVAYYTSNVDSQSEEYKRLSADLTAHRLAGLFFASNPAALLRHPPLADRSVPMVAMALPGEQQIVETIWVDRRAFFCQAMDRLASQGCRHVAVIASQMMAKEFPDPGFEAFVDAELAARHMSTHPSWIQYVSPSEAAGASNLLRLLMNDRQVDRPDGLIVADDNVAQFVAAALVSMGIRCGGSEADIHVVAHCNFPDVVPMAVPMTRIGFSAADMMAMALAALQGPQDGRASRAVHLVPPCSEAEFAAKQGAHDSFFADASSEPLPHDNGSGYESSGWSRGPLLPRG
ncbi:MAG: GntR family transcriptional regulator [Phycisphaeraceae bacterium]